jgi:hypothetical protein
MEVKFGHLEKRIKTIDINRHEIFQRNRWINPFYHKMNEEMLKEFKVELADEKLRRYKSNWLRNMTRINSNRMSKIMLNYRLNGRRRLGRPSKRLLHETETGLSRPDS